MTDERNTAAGHGVAVCVDVGTTVIKAVAFDAAGAETAVVARPSQVRQPAPGRSEQDMDQVWEAVVAVVAELVHEVGGAVRLLAVTGQGDGAWLVDRAGRPTRPAVLWNDARASALVRRWAEDGVLAEGFARTGSLGDAGQAHAILRVLAAEEPDVLARSAAVLTCNGWLFSRLTGVVGIDPSDASAPWLDSATGDYAPDLLELYGLSAHARLLPPLLPHEDRVRGLTRAAAARLGLPPGVPVVMAPYDIAATVIGCGALGADQAVAILGTTLCTEAVVAAPDTAGTPMGLTLDLGWDAGLVRAFPTLAGTGVVDWAVELLGLTAPHDVSTLAVEAPAGADGLLMLPYLSPAGERSPFLDPAASGLLLGMRFGHGRTHVARAVLEGLAHVVAECLDALPGRPEQLRVCGGGAASALWCQIIADVTGRVVARPVGSQVGARGALLCAATALGEYPDLPTAAAATPLRPPVAPDPAVAPLHVERHEAFLDARRALAPVWHREPAGARTRAPRTPAAHPAAPPTPGRTTARTEVRAHG